MENSKLNHRLDCVSRMGKFFIFKKKWATNKTRVPVCFQLEGVPPGVEMYVWTRFLEHLNLLSWMKNWSDGPLRDEQGMVLVFLWIIIEGPWWHCSKLGCLELRCLKFGEVKPDIGVGCTAAVKQGSLVLRYAVLQEVSSSRTC